MIIKKKNQKTLKTGKTQNRLSVLCLSTLLLIGCKDSIPSDKNKSISDNSMERDSISEVIIDNAILNAGGYLNWNLKKTISYTKSIQIYDSLGNLMRSVQQEHKFKLKPHLKGKMIWQQEDSLHEIIFRRGEAFMLKNGKILKDKNSTNVAWNSFFGSHYVIGMPFKLKDPGALYEYKGIDTLINVYFLATFAKCEMKH